MLLRIFKKKASKPEYFNLTMDQFDKIYPMLKMRLFHRTENGLKVIKTYSKTAKSILRSIS